MKKKSSASDFFQENESKFFSKKVVAWQMHLVLLVFFSMFILILNGQIDALEDIKNENNVGQYHEKSKNISEFNYEPWNP